MTDRVKELFETLVCNYDFPATFAEGLAEFLCDEGYVRRPSGKWLTDRFGMERSICSVCGAVFEGDGGNYCRNCGAEMVEV